MSLEHLEKLSTENKAYLSGFIDADGCILTQIIRGNSYKFGHTIRVSIVFYQLDKRNWFLMKIKNNLGMGTFRKKKDGMAELTIIGFKPVENLLKTLLPYLKIKKPLAKLVLKIIEKYKQVNTEADFLEVCDLIDKTAELTNSKNRKHTFVSVKAYLDCKMQNQKLIFSVKNLEYDPVETEKKNLPMTKKPYQS